MTFVPSSRMRLASSPRAPQRLATVVLAAILSLAVGMAALSAQPSPEVVSIISTGGYGDSHSGPSTVSEDGRYVVFSSEAGNMVPRDDNFSSDIFLRDRAAHTTALISATPSGKVGNNWSYSPACSSDGRYIAFVSVASNLVNSDGNGQPDVFVRDRVTDATECISLTPDGVPGNGECFPPGISRNGRYVVFASLSSNLTPGDTNGHGDLFVRDRVLKTTTRITQGDDFGVSSNGPVISDDGNLVAYLRYADFISRVCLLDRSAGTREVVSMAADGSASTGGPPAMSSDGRYVAFTSDAANLVADDVNGTSDAFVRDRSTATTERVSVSTNGDQGNVSSYLSALSADGRFALFSSESTNLVPNDTNIASDVFLRDRQAGTTRRVNVTSDGTQANRHCGANSLSASGRFVTFSTTATNLVAGTPANIGSVFLVDTASQALRATTLTVQPVSPTALHLSWPDTNSAEVGYEIERRVVGGVFARLANPSRDAVTFEDQRAQPGTQYEYRIRAFYQSERAPWSAIAVGLTWPAPPTNFEALTRTYNSVTLRWQDPNPIKSLAHLELRTGSDAFTEVATIPAAGSSGYLHGGLVPSTQYQFRLRLFNNSGPSVYSPVLFLTTLPAPPPAPAMLTAVVTNVQVTLSWSAATGAASYRVRRATKTGGPYTVVAEGVTGTEYVDQSVATGTPYFYVVAGVNTGGEGALSKEAAATTLPGLASLTVLPGSPRGGKKAKGTVKLDHPAPAAGSVVALASNNRNAARVPARVTIRAGGTSATFTVTTRKVSKKKQVTVTASYGGTAKTVVVTVRK